MLCRFNSAPNAASTWCRRAEEMADVMASHAREKEDVYARRSLPRSPFQPRRPFQRGCRGACPALLFLRTSPARALLAPAPRDSESHTLPRRGLRDPDLTAPACPTCTAGSGSAGPDASAASGRGARTTHGGRTCAANPKSQTLSPKFGRADSSVEILRRRAVWACLSQGTLRREIHAQKNRRCDMTYTCSCSCCNKHVSVQSQRSSVNVFLCAHALMHECR